MLAGVVFGLAAAGTTFVFRRHMDSTSWSLAATAAVWVTFLFLMILFQNLLPVGGVRFTLPLLLLPVSVAAIWNGARLIRHMLIFRPK
jgi:hypothetical protein